MATQNEKVASSNHDNTSKEDIAMDEVAIQLRNIRKTFNNGEIVACADFNLNVGDDEVVVFLGPSGCGKTTTLRMIAGLEEPDSGLISIEGEDVIGRAPKDRDLAFVFQEIALYPHMSVRKNMRFGLDMTSDLSKSEKNERVEEAAELLGLEGMLDRKPSELSGGQQQRVSLGRAMVIKPAAFLLDEPFSALDANLRDSMRVEVKKLQRRLNTAMIFVTHDQEEAMTLGDKIVIMNEGYIEQVGSAHDIYNDPATQFVAEFIGSPSTNLLDATVAVEGDTVEVDTGLFRVPIPERRLSTADLSDGQSVSLGVRPEYIELNEETPMFTAEISVIEPRGDTDAVYLQADEREIRSTTTQGEIQQNAEAVSVSLQPENIWLFDSDTGERIL
ncbi:ABC transporter ATP-binding protein [Natronorubrum halophilum]|uniref:ABC transporter ATP-binding protein n=1 Tax=Natronorubrum halophilum TaxID=1702106 RepID=UPI0010C2439A|nr:ABC transporter ATP-binding protein [Natronorubrum halophilum]